MSTSSRLAPREESLPEVRPFPYRDAAALQANIASVTDPRSFPGDISSTEVLAQAAPPASLSPQQSEQREQAARAAGCLEGEERARALFNHQLEQFRQGLQIALNGFAAERKKYYEQVEAELVKLALAIAKKILHREAQMDPLVLAGIARVMTDKVESATEVTIRVNPARAAAWREYFSRDENFRHVPAIAEDSALASDSCVIDTSLGSTELGIETQMQEIENGFADLLAKRPL
ncbi:MAG TPA: FliH/SctL family protein [Terriglobales bacterium]